MKDPPPSIIKNKNILADREYCPEISVLFEVLSGFDYQPTNEGNKHWSILVRTQNNLCAMILNSNRKTIIHANPCHCLFVANHSTVPRTNVITTSTNARSMNGMRCLCAPSLGFPNSSLD